MHSDALVMATLGGIRTPEELLAGNRRILACWEQTGFGWWIARRRSDGKFVGRGGLRKISLAGRDEIELGYGLVAEAWGQGIATEIAEASVRTAFQEMAFSDLVCFTLTTNKRSQHVMEKVGFRYERAGDYVGMPHVFYRLRRQEWSENLA